MSEPREVRLSVRLLSGRTTRVRVPPNGTVRDLKDALYRREGIPAWHLNGMTFEGGHLNEDARSLESYGIKDGCTVHTGTRGVVSAPKGGNLLEALFFVEDEQLGDVPCEEAPGKIHSGVQARGECRNDRCPVGRTLSGRMRRRDRGRWIPLGEFMAANARCPRCGSALSVRSLLFRWCMATVNGRKKGESVERARRIKVLRPDAYCEVAADTGISDAKEWAFVDIFVSRRDRFGGKRSFSAR